MRLTTPLTAAALIAVLALGACQQPTTDRPSDPAMAEQTAVMPADAPPQEDAPLPAEASSMSCTLDQGSDGAMELVRRCMAVSPASHPPCNPNNPCQLIQDEIDRACALYKPGETKPAECTA
ncbi:MAG: hypothetical protein KF910_04520 [Brevundimonas sp.]|uniref:hypothetical protein n=1 Tax=Brevundimonas sp. TaxID=1871086 RepID=UPI0025C72476|nr:hypothetical protein [Brevundimonas sp.]MBX3476847.1 hypothetical protein [Brevundimonas sp.]